MEAGDYTPPVVARIDIAVERGFASSSDMLDDTDFGDF